MSGRFSQSRASRPGKKTTANQRTLRTEPLEPRMMLSGEDLSHPILAAPEVGGWLSSASTPIVHAPTVAHEVTVNGNAAVTGKTAAISVLGGDSSGESVLRYTWSVAALPAGGNVTFAANGTNAAKNTVATFNEAGSYVLKATIADASNLSVTSTATVIVTPTLTSIRLSDANTHTVLGPTTPFAVNGASESIAAQGLDQFGNAISTQPALTWSASTLPSGATQPTFSTSSGNAAITFAKAGTYGITVKETSGGVSLSDTATLAVNPVPGSITFSSGNSVVVNGTSVQLTISQYLDEFHNSLATQPTLAWSATAIPSGARVPSFSVNGKTTTITFGMAGNYVLTATVTDGSGHTASDAVTVLVNPVATSIASGLASTVTITGTNEQFNNPKVLDQFGNALTTQPGYTWSASTLPSGAAAPSFSSSGGTTTVTFSKAGSYGLRAYVTSVSSLALTTTVIVNQTLSSITVSPASASIKTGGTDQLTAQGFDQFHNLLATQPAFAWSTTAGTISSAGLFTAPSTAGNVTVTAKSGSASGSASLTVTSNSNSTLGLNDPTLSNLVQSLDTRDGSINRADMMQILRSVGASGSVSATDFADLKTILGADATKLNIPGYVEVLAGDVVNGNPADADYLGHALGDLAAGSSVTQLDDLVNKWFMGTDLPNPGSSVLPSQDVTYESVAGSLFPHTPTIADEHQGELGDCYFISSLGTIASSNPTAIENMFLNNGDGTYTVRFYTSSGTADYVTVNSMLPTYGGTLCFADYCASPTNASNPLWIPLAEKAYAEWNETGNEGRDGTNTYAGIEGGWMGDVDAQVLGHSATDYGMTTNNEQAMIAALTSGEAVTIGTIGSSNSSDTLPYGLYGSHAYGVTGYNAANGGTFTLYNPWGFDQPNSSLTWADLQATTSGFVVANTSGTIPLGSTPAQAAVVRGGVAAPSLAAAASAFEFAGGLSSDSHPAQAALAETDAAALDLAGIRGTSASLTADATRAIFDRLGTGSEPLTFNQLHGDGQTSDPLAALSVDGLFADDSGMAEGAFAG
jgi:hypothetical protein